MSCFLEYYQLCHSKYLLEFFYIANTMLLSVFHVLVLDFLVYSAWMDLQDRQPTTAGTASNHHGDWRAQLLWVNFD
jgi:hypothetical protein